jgi:hypothetical protein
MAAWNPEDGPTYVDSLAMDGDPLAALPAQATRGLEAANEANAASRRPAPTLQGLSPYRPSAASVELEIPVDLETTQQMREEDVPSVFGVRPRAPSLAQDSHGALVVENSAVRVLRPLSYSVLADGERAPGDTTSGEHVVPAKRGWLIGAAAAAAVLLTVCVAFGVSREGAAHASAAIRSRAEHPTRNLRAAEAPSAAKTAATKGGRKTPAPRKTAR